MTVPGLKSQNRVRNYRQNPKPCSSRHQNKHPTNPYIAALFYKITLAEPDSTVPEWQFNGADRPLAYFQLEGDNPTLETIAHVRQRVGSAATPACRRRA
jgi:hypothetical protein